MHQVQLTRANLLHAEALLRASRRDLGPDAAAIAEAAAQRDAECGEESEGHGHLWRMRNIYADMADAAMDRLLRFTPR
jgi:hypothetical protein